MFTSAEARPPPRPGDLESILALVEARCGLPLSAYRRPMIERRVGHRMRRAGTPDLTAYLARLERDRFELDALVEAICIKVSRFFRDGPVFARLARVLADAVAAGRRPRLWSAGCGRGEEPYSLAALLDAAGAPHDCRVLATDADPAALAATRDAVYPADRLEEIPDEHRARFVAADGGFRPLPRLRDRVEAARHVLGADPPPPGPFDLILCRNVLIYFTRPLQQRAGAVLVDSLAPGAVLCLGEAEWLSGADARGLVPLDRQLRLLARGSP